MKKNKFWLMPCAILPIVGTVTPLLVGCNQATKEQMEGLKTEVIDAMYTNYYDCIIKKPSMSSKFKEVRDTIFHEIKEAKTPEKIQALRQLSIIFSVAIGQISFWEPEPGKGLYPLFKEALEKINNSENKYVLPIGIIYSQIMQSIPNDEYDYYYLDFLKVGLEVIKKIDDPMYIDYATNLFSRQVRCMRYWYQNYNTDENSFVNIFKRMTKIALSCNKKSVSYMNSLNISLCSAMTKANSTMQKEIGTCLGYFENFMDKCTSTNKINALISITNGLFQNMRSRDSQILLYFSSLYCSYMQKVIDCVNGKEQAYATLCRNILSTLWDGSERTQLPDKILQEIDTLFWYIDTAKSEFEAKHIAQASLVLFNGTILSRLESDERWILLINELEELISCLKQDDFNNGELGQSRTSCLISIYASMTDDKNLYKSKESYEYAKEIIQNVKNYILSTNDIIKIQNIYVATRVAIKIVLMNSDYYKLNDRKGVYYLFEEFIFLLKNKDSSYAPGLSNFYFELISDINYRDLEKYEDCYDYIKQFINIAFTRQNKLIVDETHTFDLYMQVLCENMYSCFRNDDLWYRQDYSYQRYWLEAFNCIEENNSERAIDLAHVYSALISNITCVYSEEFEPNQITCVLSLIEALKKIKPNFDASGMVAMIHSMIENIGDPQEKWETFFDFNYKNIIKPMLNADQDKTKCYGLILKNAFTYVYENDPESWINTYFDLAKSYLAFIKTANKHQALRIAYIFTSWSNSIFYQSEGVLLFLDEIVKDDIQAALNL